MLDVCTVVLCLHACVWCVHVLRAWVACVCMWTLISNAGNTGFGRADCTSDYVNKLYIMIYREWDGVCVY